MTGGVNCGGTHRTRLREQLMCLWGAPAPVYKGEGESVSTYLRRPKVEEFDNAVDVVELLLVLTNQAPNVRHLRVLHMFSSMASLELLIQQSVEGEFRQHDSVVTVMVIRSSQGFT